MQTLDAFMPSLWDAAVLGTWFGLVHALDADHLATLGGLAANDRPARAAAYALRWALGHAAALAAAAAAVLGLRFGGLEAFGRAAEWLVVLVLLALAAQSFRGVARARAALRSTAAADGESAPALLATGGTAPHADRPPRRAWWLGLLHGSAGSAAVLALLPLATAGSAARSTLYLACFSCGVAAGALAFAHIFRRLLTTAAAGRDRRLALAVQAAAGVAAMLAGVWLLRELLEAGGRLGGA